MSLKNKKVLLLAPRFFGYEIEIKNELTALGAEVLYFDERPDNSIFTKAFVRLNFKRVIKRSIDRHYSNILDHDFVKKADYLFIVSPEAFTVEYFDKLKEINPCIKVISYYWDSVFNKKSTGFLIEKSDSIFSFDKGDCAKFDTIRFLPLFYIRDYEDISSCADGESVCYDLCFIGTAHSDRYRIVKKLTGSIASKSNYLFFYSPSKILFFAKKLFDKNTRVMPTAEVSFLPLSKSSIFDILAKSSCIIDIHHPAQTGLTMRTIEMLGAEKKLITTNADVVNYDFYRSENILVIDRNNPKFDSCFMSIPYRKVDPVAYQKYSLSNWLKSIFEI